MLTNLNFINVFTSVANNKNNTELMVNGCQTESLAAPGKREVTKIGNVIWEDYKIGK